ncbi:hypothetical protein [Natrononativus amylolyticus]|uniref:hypothetical protein n=1 Tax=Natrononativus amylolyticus TaxID=2963434 RepID=UPI0020CDE54F|nr:hypothetical protein [Natrononativus amylolyticus]
MTELRIATDLLMRVHAEGTITAQFAASIGCRAEPDVQTLSPPRGHCGFLGTYDSAPGLSLDLHHGDIAETADASSRRDALTTLEEFTAEVWHNRHQVRSG